MDNKTIIIKEQYSKKDFEYKAIRSEIVPLRDDLVLLEKM